jgi:hypothetical protein
MGEFPRKHLSNVVTVTVPRGHISKNHGSINHVSSVLLVGGIQVVVVDNLFPLGATGHQLTFLHTLCR